MKWNGLDPSAACLCLGKQLITGLIPQFRESKVRGVEQPGQPFDALAEPACSWPAAGAYESHEYVDCRSAANGPEQGPTARVEGHARGLLSSSSVRGSLRRCLRGPWTASRRSRRRPSRPNNSLRFAICIPSPRNIFDLLGSANPRSSVEALVSGQEGSTASR